MTCAVLGAGRGGPLQSKPIFRVVFSNVIKERTADQPTTAGNNYCFSTLITCRCSIHNPSAASVL
jgi:hypothetical protein